MKNSVIALSGVSAIAALAGGLLLATPAAQAQSRTTTTTIEEITVTAPHTPRRGGGFTNAPIENVYVSRRIDVRDIDLRSPGGRDILDKRISAAARAACDRLDKMYPLGEPSRSTCEKETVADAQDQIAAFVAQGAY